MTLNVGGLVLGVFLGAVIPEILLGGGSLLGFFGGTLMKFVLGLVMIGIFLTALASCSIG